MRIAIVSLLLIFAVFAGCTEAPQVAAPLASSVPTELVKDGRDLRLQLQATDVIEGPLWALGDRFGHHVFFPGGPSDGFHINTIVVEDKGGSWLLATDDKEMAKFEAIIDIPIIGELKKDDLSGTGFGSPWEPYRFPLQDGKTWTADVTSGDPFMGGGETISVNYAVKYNPAIETPAGKRPGFDITGTTDGKLLLAYDFVPDIQWYAHFYSYNIMTEEPDDYDFHSMSMGHEKNWTGTYYIDTADVVLEEMHMNVVGQGTPAPPTLASFTVDEGMTYVYGFAFVVSAAGVQELMVVDPTNERYEMQAIDYSTDENSHGTFDSEELNIAAKPGEWRLAHAGAGVFTMWGAFFWQVVEQAFTMDGSAPA